MSNLTSGLEGRRFSASIGEPWDFVSAAGANRLEGNVLMVALSKDGQPALLCRVSPFKYSLAEISQVIAVNRYVGSQDILTTLHTGQLATMNFVFSVLAQEIEEADILSALANSEPKAFLVGSMELV